MTQENEFYIGWSAETPPGIARRVRWFLLGLAVLVPVAAVLTVLYQRGFSNGVFEYGKNTELQGILHLSPVPMLQVENGADPAGKPVVQDILLVAPGKFGFRHFEPGDPGLSLDAFDGSSVVLTGFLIYHDGKTAMEVSGIRQAGRAITTRPAAASLGLTTLRGEITDPKCLLGVMKPGQGKPHRECAIRCLSGGIPPLLKVAGTTGEAEYYLLVGPGGESINRELLPFAADAVQMCGRLEQQDDWLILYTDPALMQRINKYTLLKNPTCR